MSLWLILLIVAVAAGVAVGASLALHRYSRKVPFREPQHSTAALQVSGTIFAVMVGFVLLLAFQSYEEARSAARDEASATESMFETAALFPLAGRMRLQGDLICYGRSVIDEEWPSMADGPRRNRTTDRWTDRLGRGFAALRRDDIDTAIGDHWFDRNAAREGGRDARLGEAQPLVSTPVWILLLIGGAAVVGFVLLFASGRERRWRQAAVAGVVTTLVCSSLLIVAFLDSTYGDYSGAVEPRAMREAVTIMEREWLRAAPESALPCDPSGRPSA